MLGRLHAGLKGRRLQSLDLQRDALVGAEVDTERVYEDKASGRTDDRPGLSACLKSLRDGDTLVVWKLDRLDRNLRHLVSALHDLTRRGVGLKALTGQGAAIDTTTPAGKLVFGIFATSTSGWRKRSPSASGRSGTCSCSCSPSPMHSRLAICGGRACPIRV